MRQIPITASLDRYIEELEYTEAALSADSDTAELAPAFAEEIESWSAIFQKNRTVRRSVLRAEAAVSIRNQQLDEATTRFAGMALAQVNGDRKSVNFRRFFPVAPSEFIRLGLRKQCERTRDVILPELAKLDAASPLRAFAQPLAATVDAALQALEARAKVKGAIAMHGHEIEEWKEGANRLRTTTHAQLVKVGVEKGYSRAWAEAFFRAESGFPVDPAAPEPPPAPHTPSPTGA
jgi:hypothetical protein